MSCCCRRLYPFWYVGNCGSVGCPTGRCLESSQFEHFYIVGMKEPDYVMQIMTTYGTMKQLGDQKLRHVMVNGSRQVHSF